MRHASRRLPVHFLLDIDGTLLHPCRVNTKQGDDNNDDFLCDVVAKVSSEAALPSNPVLVPFSCPSSRTQRILLRPHVGPFLTHLLVDHALDTSRTEVHVSLYTRQSAAYCAAVVQRLLIPAMCRHTPQWTSAAASNPFHRLYSSAHCLQHTLDPVDAVTRPLYSSNVVVSDRWHVNYDWMKTVCVSASPLTTMLIDDKTANLRPLEVATGRAVLLPSFGPKSDDFMFDACLAVPNLVEEEDALYDALSSGGGAKGEHHAATAGDSFGDAIGLLELLTAFVEVCHTHHDAIVVAQQSDPFLGTPYTEEDPSAQQAALRARIQAHATPFAELSLLDLSPHYRRVWNAFHASRENLLSLVLADFNVS